MPPIPPLSPNQIRELADIIQDAVTHEELSNWFGQLGIPEELPLPSKPKRLTRGLLDKQRKDNCANLVFQVILWSLEPVRYMRQAHLLEERRTRINEILAFSGLQIDEQNQIRIVVAARTVDEARERAGKLRNELTRRGVHPEVLRFCGEEYLRESYYHGTLEASKSPFERIRSMTGLVSDGASLVDTAFAVKDPYIALNSLRTETEQSQQAGLAHLLKGIHSHFRNPPAHTPRVVAPEVDEQDAMDLLTTLSYIHRCLDRAIVVKRVEDPLFNF